MTQYKKSMNMWKRGAARHRTLAAFLTVATAFAPFAALPWGANAASYINTAVPSNASLSSGLVLYYSFDGTKVNASNGSITDESGNSKTGTYKKSNKNNATSTPGRLGQAINFDSITASTTIGNVSSSVKSVAFWVKVATSTTQQNIIDLNGSGANIEIVSGTVTANGFTNPTIYVDGAVSSTLNDTNWHHVVVTTGTAVNASNVSLGVVGTTYFGGTLDDLRVYNRALSASEVTRIYHLGATSYVNTTNISNINPNNSSGLVLFYSFDNTKVSRTTITDESGNGKTGTVGGATIAVYLTSGTTWVAPTGVTSVKAEVIGGGGGTVNGGSSGGGGGAYSAKSGIAVTPGSSYQYSIGVAGGTGAAGGDTYFCNSTSNCASISGTAVQAGAKGGTGSSGGGAGGAAGSGVGDAKFSGGDGGGDVRSGGGGAAGPGGAGAKGGTGNGTNGGAGGGGNGGGTAGTNGITGQGGAGGNNSGGTGGTAGATGTNNSSNASNGGGAGGTVSGASGNGGNGTDLGNGKGGGGGGGGSSNQCGGAGSYGGGGGESVSGGCGGGPGVIKLTIQSGLSTPGRLGQAINFDGVTASTTIGNVSSSVKSVAFWAKVSTSTTAQNIMDFNGNGTNIRIVSGVVTANGFTSPTIYVDGAVSSTLNDTNWHHVVVTTGTNVNVSNMNLGIASSTYFGGTLDDLRVYNRALSASEVTRIYHLGATSYINTTSISNINPNNANGLLLFYSFDGTKVNASNGSITDESGNSKTGTYKKSNKNNATSTPGRLGQAINFDSITASTTIGNVSSSVKSVAFWAKVSTSTTAQNIMDFNGNGTNIRIVSGVVTANGFTSPTIYVDGAVSSTLNDTNWHHVVVTTGTNVNVSNMNLGIASSTYFGGTLDDVRLYNRALSASDVTRLYHLGN